MVYSILLIKKRLFVTTSRQIFHILKFYIFWRNIMDGRYLSGAYIVSLENAILVDV